MKKKETSKFKSINKMPKRNWLAKLEETSGKKVLLNPQKNNKAELNSNVYLTIDCSSSMSSANKMSQAKQGAIFFAKEAFEKGYQVGLVKFDSYANHIVNPLNEIGKLEEKIYKLTPCGSTNMSDAIDIANKKLSELNGGMKVICLVTDGEPDDRELTLKAAKQAKNKDIEIMTIGTDDADRDFLALLATKDHLAIKVENQHLESGISSMAKLLPLNNYK